MTEELNPSAPTLPKSRNLIITLAGIAMISGLLVVLTFQLTLPRITQNRQDALERAVFTVLPFAETRTNYLLTEAGLEELPDADFARANVFAGYDQTGTLTGLAMEASARGYQDVVKILYGYAPDTECVVGITVLESRETPGLGDKVESDPDFLDNFACLDAKLTPDGSTVINAIETVKHDKKTNEWQIDAISGATITSTAVGNALSESTQEMLPLLAKHRNSLKTHKEPELSSKE
jgi:Na+-translocating ferredoxin:NAD+ oxidoreductase subunit G